MKESKEISFRNYKTQRKKIFALWNSRKREKGRISTCKTIMTEKFSNLGRHMDIQIHESQGTQIIEFY